MLEKLWLSARCVHEGGAWKGRGRVISKYGVVVVGVWWRWVSKVGREWRVSGRVKRSERIRVSEE